MSKLLSGVKVTTIDVRGAKVAVHVTTSGYFEAEVGDRRLAETTLAGLREAVMKETKRKAARVEVAGLHFNSNRQWKRVVGRGFHAGNGNVLVDYGNGSEQLSGHTLRLFRADMPSSVRDEYSALSAQEDEVCAKVRALEEKWCFDLRGAVHSAVESEAAKS